MTDVQYTDEQYGARARSAVEPKGLYKMVITWGLAKDRAGAQLVLVGIMILALLLTFIAPSILGTSTTLETRDITSAELERAMEMNPGKQP